MTTETPCVTCGERNNDLPHRIRCDYENLAVETVLFKAATYGIEAVKARDLFAHMRTIGADVNLAKERAICVMELGWRPTS